MSCHTKNSLSVVAMLAIGACATTTTVAPGTPSPPVDSSLEAVIQPLGASAVTGQLLFTAGEHGVLIEGTIQGLSPGSRHGFHVHEIGDCSDPQGKSAGGHFNPSGHSHGGLEQASSHLGDLGNIEADAAGTAKIVLVKSGATLKDGPNAYLGRSVIVHEAPDDFVTQPTGNSGARVACGVIRVRTPGHQD